MGTLPGSRRGDPTGAVVTFDVFSALTDSRSGGSSFFDGLLPARGWDRPATEMYDRWDTLNKELHRTHRGWTSFRELSASALGAAYSEFGLPPQSVEADSDALLDSMSRWPLWPDVSISTLAELGVEKMGLLSNIDDELLNTTAVVRLGVFDPDFIVTSERMRAYKPSRALYSRAVKTLGSFTHVASSARDVRGALQAGIDCIRLARPGHPLDPRGPRPARTAGSIPELGEVLLNTRR